MAEKLFTEKAVLTAIQLAVKGTARILNKEEAVKMIESLPEDLADMVMSETLKAFEQQAAKRANIIASVLQALTEETPNDESKG